MPSFDNLKGLSDIQTGAAGRGTGDALSDMQQRLAQLSHQIDQVRSGAPEPQAQMLGRIEAGIQGLGERLAAIVRQRPARPPALPAHAATDEDNPWDADSAEALTRAYEAAEAEERYNPQPRPPRMPPPLPAEAHGTFDPGRDRAWMEQRFGDIAGLLGQSLAHISPDQTVAALAERLDRFEQRLDAALETLTRAPDAGALERIEGHIAELAGQLEATQHQLGRFDAIDEQLRDLAHMLESHRSHAASSAAGLTVETVKSLIDTAAERAAGRLAASLPAAATGGDGENRARIEALEALLQDYLTERNRGEDVSGGILHTIEDALVRIVDRIDAMEAAKPDRVAQNDSEGLAIESERLAQAYAAGARVLGHPSVESSLNAADYAPAEPRGPDRGTPRGSADAPPPVPAQEPEMRQELRASALRAKLKAQATQAPGQFDVRPGQPPAADAGQPVATRPRAKASAGTPRFSLLLLAAMTVLFGIGYLAVDVLVSGASSAKPAAALAGAKSRPGAISLQPAQATPAAAPAPAELPATVPQAPAQDAGRDLNRDLGQDEPATLRQVRQRARADGSTGSLAATPVNLVREAPVSLAQGALPLPDVAEALGLEAMPPAGVGTTALRYAAAGGDPAAQFEVASRLADGKGVAPDQALAFVWFQRAATRGHVPAQFRLGVAFERGIGVTADGERAKVWYRRAADKGHVRAMHNLAVLSVGDDAARADYATAARWFTRAAEQGLADSQYNIGVLCENGLGVTLSLADAYKWYALAARGGDREAARRLETIKARLAPDELAAADQQTARWRARTAVGG